MQKKDDIYGSIIIEMASLGLKNQGLLVSYSNSLVVSAKKKKDEKIEEKWTFYGTNKKDNAMTRIWAVKR